MVTATGADRPSLEHIEAELELKVQASYARPAPRPALRKGEVLTAIKVRAYTKNEINAPVIQGVLKKIAMRTGRSLHDLVFRGTGHHGDKLIRYWPNQNEWLVPEPAQRGCLEPTPKWERIAPKCTSAADCNVEVVVSEDRRGLRRGFRGKPRVEWVVTRDVYRGEELRVLEAKCPRMSDWDQDLYFDWLWTAGAAAMK